MRAMKMMAVAAMVLGVVGAAHAGVITVNATALCHHRYWPASWGAWTADAPSVYGPTGGSEGGNQTTSWLKFQSIDFSGMDTITSATLTLAAQSGNDASHPAFTLVDTLVGNVFVPDNDWTVDGAVRPTRAGGSASPDAHHSPPVEGYASVADITSIVQDWKDGVAGQFGLGVSDPDGSWEKEMYIMYRDTYQGVTTSITIEFTEPQAIPEPGVMGLFAVGGLGVVVRRRRS